MSKNNAMIAEFYIYLILLEILARAAGGYWWSRYIEKE